MYACMCALLRANMYTYMSTHTARLCTQAHTCARSRMQASMQASRQVGRREGKQAGMSTVSQAPRHISTENSGINCFLRGDGAAASTFVVPTPCHSLAHKTAMMSDASRPTCTTALQSHLTPAHKGLHTRSATTQQAPLGVRLLTRRAKGGQPESRGSWRA